jgi:hypothetical protein
MSNPTPSIASTVGSIPAFSMGKSAAKIFSTKIPRNPLKRLVSDERLQGNPTPESGFSQRKAHHQENQNANPRQLAV